MYCTIEQFISLSYHTYVCHVPMSMSFSTLIRHTYGVLLLNTLSLQGISVMRKGLEAQLQERMSEDLTLMQTMGQQQQEMLDSRLAVLREQQEQTQELLGGGLSALMSTTSPGKQ